MTRLQWYYYEPDGRGRAYQFWKNFMAHIHTYTKSPDGVWNTAANVLAEYNANIVDKDYIKFETEEDKTFFLLRWSA
jgi:hypothetical protein